VILLLALAAFAAMAALAFWWIRRENLAPVRVGRQASGPPTLAPGCDIGVALMSTTEERAPSSSSSAPSQPGVGAGKPGGTPAPRRQVRSGPTRRAFLRTSWMVGFLGFVGTFSGATIAFLWPNLRGGFGAEIDVDEEETILAYIEENNQPFAYPAGRMWLTRYDPALDPEGVYSEVVAEGSQIMALYQKCVHLGCRVPWNEGLGRFACPCHGSNYNFWGEYIIGPAPRGLDRFAVRTENGRVLVNTSTVVTGPSRQTHVWTDDSI
jgi:cytochrome b6-f complex iron-sulfur subunit